MIAWPVADLGAQSPLSGDNVVPVYEGFWANVDGSYDMLFGYYNRNWEEELEVPVGSDNHLAFVEAGALDDLTEPADDLSRADAGQPTHFFPRRSQFVFRVPVPADFGDREVVWTLTTNGVTERAYGTLRPEYRVDDVVMSANFGAGGMSGFNPQLVGNTAPQLTLETEESLTVRVGEPVTLTALASDDGKPSARGLSARLTGESHEVPNSATGLRFSWFHYRGPGNVTFDPPQTKVWQDNRDGANSPWAAGWTPPPLPPDNRWVARATFSEPGTYVIRGLAHDGGLVDYADITVSVEP
jgi:hypothetical protein